MLRTMRTRPRPDTLVSEKRRATNHAGRLVYFVLLVLSALLVLDYLVGDFVFLRANGLVVRDRTVVSAVYLARVERVNVVEGQGIAAGAPLLRLQSTEMLERLADLSARRAELVAREADFRIRSAVVAQLLPLAEKREAETERVIGKFDRLSDAGLATAAGYASALASGYSAKEARVRLLTESGTLAAELAALEAARGVADRALADLEDHYARGEVRAPVAGSVGASVPSPGQVFRPGDEMLTIHSGETIVLAYLPRRYLFPIRPGLQVRVSNGRQSARGEVAEILPLTDALPREFQNTFRPRDRGQLAKIRFAGPPPFPINEKVDISPVYFAAPARAAGLTRPGRPSTAELRR